MTTAPHTPQPASAQDIADLLNLDPAEPYNWREDALCAQVSFELFFPERGSSSREGKAVCSDCPVRRQCLEFAIANGEREGIWGGLSPSERRQYAKDNNMAFVATPIDAYLPARRSGDAA